MAGSFASGFGELGGAVSSIFGGIGDFAEGSAYGQAAKLANINANISKESTAVQEFQASHQINQVIGAQRAAVGGAGLRESGSALDLLHSSQQQGALQKALIQEQGTINTQSYQAEADAYKGMQQAADAAGAGGILGGIMQGVGAVMMMSDERLKVDVRFVRPSHIPGVGLYTFRYRGQAQRFEGVMAQEVAKVRPDAVIRKQGGFLAVDYAALGIEPKAA